MVCPVGAFFPAKTKSVCFRLISLKSKYEFNVGTEMEIDNFDHHIENLP
jgi:hypothetical protein